MTIPFTLRITATVLATAVSGFLATGASATSLSFTTTADGQTGQNAVGQLPTIGGGASIGVSQSGSLLRNGIFEFDLSAIPDTATIDAASFTWVNTRFISNTGGNPAAVDLFASDGDGVVTDADHIGGTQVADTSIASGGSGGDVSTVAFTDLVPVASALPGNLLTIRLETDSFASIQVAGLANTTWDAASLTVEFTDTAVAPPPIPLPAGLPLLLAGFGSLAWLRTRRIAG